MTHHEYDIVLSSNLGINPTDFAATWNETAETRNVGEARVIAAKDAQYVLSLITIIFISMRMGAASNIISDLIMKVFERRGIPKHMQAHIEQMKKPDSNENFVVDVNEE